MDQNTVVGLAAGFAAALIAAILGWTKMRGVMIGYCLLVTAASVALVAGSLVWIGGYGYQSSAVPAWIVGTLGSFTVTVLFSYITRDLFRLKSEEAAAKQHDAEEACATALAANRNISTREASVSQREQAVAAAEAATTVRAEKVEEERRANAANLQNAVVIRDRATGDLSEANDTIARMREAVKNSGPPSPPGPGAPLTSTGSAAAQRARPRVTFPPLRRADIRVDLHLPPPVSLPDV